MPTPHNTATNATITMMARSTQADIAVYSNCFENEKRESVLIAKGLFDLTNNILECSGRSVWACCNSILRRFGAFDVLAGPSVDPQVVARVHEGWRGDLGTCLQLDRLLHVRGRVAPRSRLGVLHAQHHVLRRRHRRSEERRVG